MSNEFTLGFLMWLGLMSQSADRPPTYEMNHFYYHDTTNAIRPLPFQNKLWLPPEEKAKAFINTYQLQYEKLDKPHKEGYLVSFESKTRALMVMKRLEAKKIPFQPVVLWEDMLCVPTNKILGELRPFVTEPLLKNRLVQLRAFKIGNVQMESNQCIIEVDTPMLPPNMFAVANMLSEDTAWFSWARCLFEPVHSPISATMTITQGQTDLGMKRYVEVTISVYKPSIKVRKDLIPKLGQSRWAPLPQKEDYWYDFDASTITETVKQERTVIKIVYPFRYLNFGEIVIQPMSIPYEDGKRKSECFVAGVNYKNTSIIEGTSIEDLQAISLDYKVSRLAEPTQPPKQLIPLTSIGGAVLASGSGLFALWLLIGLVRLQRSAMRGWLMYDNKVKLWNALHAIAKKIGKGDATKWREQYLEAERRLMAIMAEFFGHTHPVASDDPSIKSGTVRKALAELEKLYKPNAKPDMRALSGHLLRVYTEGEDV